MAEDVNDEYMDAGDEGGDGGTEVVDAGVEEGAGDPSQNPSPGAQDFAQDDNLPGAGDVALQSGANLPAELQNVREVPGHFDSRVHDFVGVTDADRGPSGADLFRMPTYGESRSSIAGLFNEPEAPDNSALSFDLGKAAENLANQKPTWEAKTAPIFFDWKESKADRYVQSGDMRKLGFRSWEDNEERYAAHQTWGEVLSNSFGGMKELAWNTFADGWAGWGRMADAVFNRDLSKIRGDAEDLEELHEEQAAIFDKYAIYASKESEDSIFNRQFVGNLIQQSGFALGAMGQFITENIVFMGLGNLAKPFSVASTIGRATLTTSEMLADATRIGATWRSGRFATKLYNGLKTGTKAVGTGLTKAARLTPIGGDLITAYRGGARGMELALKGMGSMRRTIGEFNMASTEARYEAAELAVNLKKQLRADRLAKTGATHLSPEEEAEIEQMAMEGASYGYGSNVLLLAVMNRLSMGNLIRTFGMDKRLVQGLAAEGIAAGGGKIGRVVKGTAAREIKVGEKVVKQGYRLKQAYGKHYLGALGNYRSIARDFGKVTALKEVGKSAGRAGLRASLEGLEEEEQEMVKSTIEDYYGDLGKGKATDLYRSISNAALKQLNFQGAKTFLSGALTGGIVGPVAFGVRKGIERIQKGKNAGEVAKAHKKALDDLNAFFVNPEHYLSKWVVNTNIQDQAGAVMDEAVEKRDKYTYFNAKNIANDSTLWTAVESGMGEALLQHVKDLATYMPEEQLNEAFGPREKGEWKGYLKKVATDMGSYISDVKKAEAKFDEYFMQERYADADKKDLLMARTAYRQIIRENVSNRYMIKEAQKRKQEILEEATKVPGVGEVSHFAFNVLSNKKVLEGRIALLRQGLAADEQAQDPSEELKQRIARRRKELSALEGILRTDVTESEEDAAADAAARAAHEEQVKAARGEGGVEGGAGDPSRRPSPEAQDSAQDDNRGADDKGGAKTDDKKKGAVVIMPSDKGREAQSTGKGAVVIQPSVTGANRASVIEPSAPNAEERQPMKAVGSGVVVLGAPIAKRLSAMRAYIEAVAEENGREVLFTDKDLEDFDVLLEDYRKLGADVLRLHNALALQENPRKFLPTFVETEKALNARKAEMWLAGQEELKRAAKEQAERLAAQRRAEGKPPEADDKGVEGADEMDAAEDAAAEAGEEGVEGADATVGHRTPRSYNGFREGQFVQRKDREGTFYISKIDDKDITFLSLDRGISFKVSKKSFDGLVEAKEVARVYARDVFGHERFGAEMQLLPESRGGLFVVKLNKKDEAYVVVDRNMNYVYEGDIDARRIYIRRAQAVEVLDAVLAARAAKEEQQSFVFDGKRLRVGDVLEDKNGKEYTVKSKVREVDGKEMIHLLREDTEDDKQVTSLKRFRLKRKAGVDDGAGDPSATAQDDKKRFRIRRPKLLMSVYAHVRDKIVGKKRKDLTAEEAKQLRVLRKEAEAELSQLLRTTTQEELQEKLTIHIRRNTDGAVEVAEEGGPFENRNLRLNPEPYTVELRYADKPIGYLTYYNRYQYQDAQGNVYDTDKLTKAQFAAIFDTSRGQQADMLQEEFKRAYREGKKVYQVIEGLMAKSKSKELVLAGDQLQGLFDVHVGFGSYDWLAKDAEPVVELKDFGLNNVGGKNVVLVKRREYVNAVGDWRTNEVMVTNEPLSPEEEADLRERIKEARLNEEEDTTRDRDMGSYIAVVELPNGKLRFLDLAIPPAEARDLAEITEQLNKQMEKTRRENVVSEDEVNDTRFNEAFNEGVLGKIFVATYLGQKGLYIKPELNEYGEIKISYWNNRRREEGVVTVPTQEGKPFGNFQEVLDAINKAIVAYNAEEPTGTRLSKVEIKLEHIKKDITADAGWDELQHLRVKVGADVVRNVGMTLRAKKAQGKQKTFTVPTVVEPPTVSPTAGQVVGKGAAVVMPGTRGGMNEVVVVGGTAAQSGTQAAGDASAVGMTTSTAQSGTQEAGAKKAAVVMPGGTSGMNEVVVVGGTAAQSGSQAGVPASTTQDDKSPAGAATATPAVAAVPVIPVTDAARRKEILQEQNKQLAAGKVLDKSGKPVTKSDEGIRANGLATLTDKKWASDSGGIKRYRNKAKLAPLDHLEEILNGGRFEASFGLISNAKTVPGGQVLESGEFTLVTNDMSLVATNGKLNPDHAEIILNAGLSPFAQELANKYPTVVIKDFNGKQYKAEGPAVAEAVDPRIAEVEEEKEEALDKVKTGYYQIERAEGGVVPPPFRSTAMYGEGILVFTGNAAYSVKRYGKPMEGEVNEDEFEQVDARQSPSQLYETLMAMGYEFAEDHSMKTGDMSEFPTHATEFFEDFRKSNPGVKGVKVINHRNWGGTVLSDFFVVYDDRSVHEAGALTEEITKEYDKKLDEVAQQVAAGIKPEAGSQVAGDSSSVGMTNPIGQSGSQVTSGAATEKKQKDVVLRSRGVKGPVAVKGSGSDAMMAAEMLMAHRTAIEAARDEELRAIGLGDVAGGLEELRKAKTVVDRANVLNAIEHSVQEGAPLSAAQEQELSAARESLAQEGYEVIAYAVVPNEVDAVVNPARPYQGEILSEEQVELLEGSIAKLERRKRNSRLSYDVDDLPEVVARVVRPEVSKDGKVLQGAVLDTLRFDSMSEVERAIERSRAAGFVQTRAADEIRAKYDEALEDIVDSDSAMLFIEDEGEGFEEMEIGPSPAAQDDRAQAADEGRVNVQVGDAVSDLQVLAAEHEVEKTPVEEVPAGMDEELTLDQMFAQIEILEGQLVTVQAAVFNKLTEGKDLSKVNMEKVDEAVQAHPRVVAMREALQDMETRLSTYKVATSEELKTADIVHIELFRKWMKENLPEGIELEVVEKMADDMLQKGTPVGRFLYAMDEVTKEVKGKVQVMKGSAFKYHEAFHAVFRLLLNDEQIEKYLAVGKEEVMKDLRAKQAARIAKGEQKEAKDDEALLEDALDDLLELRPGFYGKMSREELEERYYEEHMADAFDRWKQDRKVRTPNLYKGFFGLIQRLGDWLAGRKGKIAKGLGIRRSELERLFYDINDRQFKGAAIADNRYTRELEPGGDPHMAWKDIVLGKKKERFGKRWVERDVLMSQGKAADLISSITATVLERKRADPGADIEALLDKVFDDYAGLYDKRRAYYMQMLRDGEAKKYYRIAPELDQLRDLFLEGREQLAEAVRGHLDGIAKLEDRIARDERGVLQDEQVGVANMVPELRAYLSSIAVMAADDYDNLLFDNDQPLMQAVNIEELYMGLQKSGAEIGNIHQMLLGMERFGEYNHATYAFMERFKEDVGLEPTETGYKATKNQHLFYMVMKAFEQYTPDHLYFNRDIRRERSYLVKSNTYDSVKSQVSLWYNSFMELFYTRLDGMGRDDKREFIEKATSGLALFADSSQGFKVEDEDMKERATRISNQLKEGLGIDLHPMYIMYSLASAVGYRLSAAQADQLRTPYQRSLVRMYGKVKPLKRDAAQDLHKLLKEGKNPFHSNMDNEDLRHVLEEEEMSRRSVRFEALQTDRMKGNKTRFFRIGYANSFFDEKIHTTRFRAADGTRTNAFQYPDFYVVKARDVLRSLGEDPGDAPTGWMRDLYFGDNHYLLHQKQFRHIADRIMLSALDGMGPIKARLTWERKFGMLAERSRETGIKYSQYTGRDNMSNLIELYFVNTLHSIAKDSKQLKADEEEAEKQQKKDNRGRKPLDPELAKAERDEQEAKEKRKKLEAEAAAKKAGAPTEEEKKKSISFMTSLHRIGAVGNSDMVYTAELPVVKVVELRTVKVDENEVLQEFDEIEEETDHTGSGKGKGAKKIRKREEVHLTKGARQAFVNEVQREFDEIRRAAKVIRRLKEGTLKEDDEVIEGYHTKGKNGEAPRGLQLLKTGHMLEEDVRAELERLAASNQGTSEDIFDEYEQVVGDQIEKYWLGEKGLLRTGVIHDLIEELVNTDVIYREKRGGTSLYKNKLLPYYIRQGYHGAERKVNTERNELMNILPDKIRHNIAQIVINDYLNTNAFHQLLHGNRSKTSEDPRQMGDQGEVATFKAPSVHFAIPAPDLGIKHAGERSHVVHVRNIANADGAVWLTPKAYRHMLYGSGKLTSEYVQMLDKIEKGEAVEGTLPTVRVMYYDGAQDIEAVGVVLLPGQEGEMEALRRKLEAYEKKHKTFVMATPLGSSHGKQSNVANDAASITDRNFREMDNKYLRLQMETPVGLTEKEVRRVEHELLMGPVEGVDEGAGDPSRRPSATPQDSAQDDNRSAAAREEERRAAQAAAVKEHKRLKEVYLKNTADRAQEVYEVARDAVFGMDSATEAFRTSVEQGSVTPELADFLRKAVAELEQAGADSQFLSFFSLNEEGGPKYNLNLPQTAAKFEELFTAYFARAAAVGNKMATRAVSALPGAGVRVVREVVRMDEQGRVQETRVVPAAVVEQDPELYSDVLDLTAEGVSNPSFAGISHPELGKFFGERAASGRRTFLLDHLRSDVPVYGENGAIVDYYDEYIMGAPNAEVEAAVRKTGVVPAVLQDGFAMRNAGEGGAGANRMQLVDVLPRYHGAVGVFADRQGQRVQFDRDRVHVGMRDVYSRRDGDAFWFLEEVSREDTKARKGTKGVMSFHAYGETQGAEGEFEEYLVWMARNDERVKEGLKAQAGEVARERVEAVMKELGLPGSAEAYRELKKVKGRELNVGRMNNVILDAQMGMAGKKKIATATEQGGIQVAKVLEQVVAGLDVKDENGKVSNYVKDRLEMESNLDRDMVAGKEIGFRDKKEATEQLPAVQDALSVFPYLHGFGVEQRKELSNGDKLWHLKIDGVSFNTYKNGRAYNPETKKFDGPVVGDVLSSLNGAVVNSEVRAQMAALFDFNAEALSIVGNMVAQGVPMEWAVQFMMQPIIQDYYRKVKHLSSPIKTGVDSLRAVHNIGRDMLVDARNYARLDRIRQEVMKEFMQELEKSGKKLNPDMFRMEFDNRVKKAVRARRERVVEAMDLSADMLEQNIKDKGTNKVYEYSVFKTFMRMREQAEHHEALQGLLGAIQEPGKGDPKQVGIYVEKLGLLDDDRAFGLRKVPIDLRQLLGPTPAAQDKVNAGQLAIHRELEGLLQQVLLSRTGLFRDMVESTLANFAVINKRRAEAEQTLKTELLGHLTLRAYQKLLRDNEAMDRLWSLSNGLMYNEVYAGVKKKSPRFMNIVEVLEALKGNPALKDNTFLQFLHSIPTHVVMGTQWVTKEGYEVDPAEVKRKEGPPTTFGDDIKMATGIGALPGEVLGAGEILVEDELIEVVELPILQANDYNQEGFNQVAVNTWSKLNRHEVQRVKEDFLKIYDNKETNSLAWALFHYLLVRDGGQIGSGSFLPYIPNFMFRELSEAMGKVHEVFMDAGDPSTTPQATPSEKSQDAFQAVFGVSKQELLNRFVSSYVSHPANIDYAPKVHVKAQNSILSLTNKFTKDELVEKYMPETHSSPKRSVFEFDFWGDMSEEVKAAGRLLQEEAVTGEKQKLSAEEERARLMFEKHVALFKSRMFEVHGFGEQREAGVEEAWDQEDYEAALEDEGVAERKVREGYIEFPFIVKDVETDEETKMPRTVYFSLESIDGVKVDSEEAIRFIDETRKVARGTKAHYVLITVNGSKAQSAASAISGVLEKVTGFGTEAWGIRDMEVPAGFGLKRYRPSAKEVMEERERAAELEEWVTNYVPLVVRFEEEFGYKVQMVDLGGGKSYVRIMMGEGEAPNHQELLDEFFRRVDEEDARVEALGLLPATKDDKGRPAAIEEAKGLIHVRNAYMERGRVGRGLLDVEEEEGREWRGLGDAEETIKLILNARAPKGYDVAVHRGEVPGMEIKALVDVAVADVVEMAEGHEVYEEIVKMLHETMGEKQCK